MKRCSQFPDPQGFYNGPGAYQQNSETKLRTLENFKKVIKYLRPKHTTLSSPVLWHTDLHSDNIFVDEQDATEITATIDWQAVNIAPLFAQARHPGFLEFDGEKPASPDPSTIRLPDNYDNLDADEKKAAKKLRSAQMLWKLYEVELICQSKDINTAIRFGRTIEGRLHSFVGNVFSDGELLVEDLLIQLQQRWSQVVQDVAAEPCPLSFRDENIAEHERQYAEWEVSIEAMSVLFDMIGGYRGWEGSVSHEQFDAAR